eukprot:SAG11_NODE_4441_length_1894_cov_1.455710_1_plen_112_part_00
MRGIAGVVVPGPPAWWLGSGRESPATGLAGREAKHTSVYRAFTERAEQLLATIDESVMNSTVASHIQGCVLSLPFLIPPTHSQRASPALQCVLATRVGSPSPTLCSLQPLR